MAIKKGLVGFLLIIVSLLSVSFMDNEDYERRLQASREKDETIYIQGNELIFLTEFEVMEIRGRRIEHDCVNCPQISRR